jgi:hypothetical protein
MVLKRLRLSALILSGSVIVTGMFLTMPVEGQRKTRKRTVKAIPRVTPTPAESGVVSRDTDFPIELLQGSPTVPMASDQPLMPSPTSGTDATIEELRERLARLEASKKNDPDERQRRLSVNLDILTKSEQRSDALRKQLFEMIEKESSIRTRVDQIANEMRPDAIERVASMTGSLRPEELREQRRRSLEIEKQNLQILLTEVQKNKANLELNLGRADSLVERLRTKLEKEVNDALAEDENVINDPEN